MEEKMKIKKIKIKVMEMNEWFDHVESVLKNFNKGTFKEYPATVSFANLALIRKTLTPRRMQLLSVIKHKKPSSIYELAKVLKRDRKAVTTDINMLKELGFIKMRKQQRERTIVKPEVHYGEIEIGVKL